MTGALVLRGDARRLPLPDESVDLIVTSPPYFAQRSYKDGGEHFAGQLGSEATPQEFLDALWAVTAECWRVLKPSGSMFVNLGDKRSGSSAPGTTTGLTTLAGTAQQQRTGLIQGRRAGITTYTQAAFGRPKSKQLLPQRYAIGCEDGAADPDGIGWIVRAELVWSKPNGMPESVQDRVRDSHEAWWHLTKQGAYYSALDEIREPHAAGTSERYAAGYWGHSLGKVPGSVWSIPTEPLQVPEHLEVDHFAAFPSEWPRRLILGWSPPAICLECGEGRWPVVEVAGVSTYEQLGKHHARNAGGERGPDDWTTKTKTENGTTPHFEQRERTILGYACSCTPAADLARWTPPPSRPAVVLDPFGGTGTTAMVARALGRLGISVDLSTDYCRLARWRIFQSGHGAKAVARTNQDRQGQLL